VPVCSSATPGAGRTTGTSMPDQGGPHITPGVHELRSPEGDENNLPLPLLGKEGNRRRAFPLLFVVCMQRETQGGPLT